MKPHKETQRPQEALLLYFCTVLLQWYPLFCTKLLQLDSTKLVLFHGLSACTVHISTMENNGIVRHASLTRIPPGHARKGFLNHTLYLSPDGSLVRPGWWVFPSLCPSALVVNLLRGWRFVQYCTMIGMSRKCYWEGNSASRAGPAMQNWWRQLNQ